MRLVTFLNPFAWYTRHAIALICLVALAPALHASDLPAASDGEHLWLIEQTPAPQDNEEAGPQLKLYHLPADTDRYIATKLDPIAGELMPRGLAAGDGRLLIVTDNRQLITVRPEWSELLRQSVYQKRTLASLPEGCTLVALTMGDRGPWALVKVESRELLDRLDGRDEKQAKPTDQQLLNRALGMPEDFDWGQPAHNDSKTPEQDEPAEDSTEPPADDEVPAEPSDAEEGELSDTERYAQTVVEPVALPALPAYRLIVLRNREWRSSPLPDGFTVPGEVTLLIRPGDDRPTLLVESNRSFGRSASLIRYNPIDPVQSDSDVDAELADADAQPQDPPKAWERLVTGMQLPPGRQWSADLVNDQIVIALEQYRQSDLASIDLFRLRDQGVFMVGSVNLSTGENARWALMPKQDDIGVIASPAPPPAVGTDPDQLPVIAMLAGLTINGQPIIQNAEGVAAMMPISEKRPTFFDGNADLTIQIIAFIAAMFMMVMFYRRAPQPNQLDLPEHLVLASFGRRAMAGLIDLAPGFFLASLLYGVTVSEILFESWPGNGVEKAFAAMRPGFVVIGVTLLHTVACEFILARSLGKILAGLYVADLNGKPAPPAPCLGRALSRAFELFAPLMILVAIISPARQRLGDILAKTIVVMRKPEPIKFDDDQEL